MNPLEMERDSARTNRLGSRPDGLDTPRGLVEDSTVALGTPQRVLSLRSESRGAVNLDPMRRPRIRDLHQETGCRAGGILGGQCVRMHGLGPDVPRALGIEMSVAWRRSGSALYREGPLRRDADRRPISVLIKPWWVRYCHV